MTVFVIGSRRSALVDEIKLKPVGSPELPELPERPESKPCIRTLTFLWMCMVDPTVMLARRTAR
jgi:hypothetical protein